jgi:hypothetical protein
MADKHVTPREFRNTVAKELDQLGALLVSEQICVDASPLHGASSKCQSYSGDQWGYDFAGLTLQVGDSVKCVPTHITKFTCRLDVLVMGSVKKLPPQADPLEQLQVQIELRADNKKNPSSPFLQAWHFDRHPGPCAAPKTAHPRYHLSVGGNRIKAYLSQLGKPHFDGVLLLDSPRLSHPPLDGILAIDFVLSHFSGSDWRRLSQLPAYQRIVSNSVARLWQPYAHALCVHWSTDHAAKKVWPIAELWPTVV